jgi:hypothetical protein
MSEAPKTIWANVAVWGNGEPLAGEWNYRDVGRSDDTQYTRTDTIPSPDALIRAALEEAADACTDNTWRHLGDDAYSRGLDRGALEQASACAASVRSLANDPEALAAIKAKAEGRG